MKKLVFCFLFFSVFMNGYAQDVVLKHSDLEYGKKKPKGKFTVYESENGTVYRLDDILTIGMPSSNKIFAFITTGDGIFTPVEKATIDASGERSKLFKIYVGGTKKTGYQAYFRSKGYGGISNYGIEVEDAIKNNELESSGLTSDQALEELKKAKSKLDLELITQDEYNKVKNELIKYIN